MTETYFIAIENKYIALDRWNCKNHCTLCSVHLEQCGSSGIVHVQNVSPYWYSHAWTSKPPNKKAQGTHFQLYAGWGTVAHLIFIVACYLVTCVSCFGNTSCIFIYRLPCSGTPAFRVLVYCSEFIIDHLGR